MKQLLSPLGLQVSLHARSSGSAAWGHTGLCEILAEPRRLVGGSAQYLDAHHWSGVSLAGSPGEAYLDRKSM